RRMTLCPFHVDRVPSLSCDFTRGLYKCHACGESGNTWTMIMKKEGIDFGRARAFATEHGFTEGEHGSGGESVRGSAYGGRRSIPTRKRNRQGTSSYIPSWRRT